MQEIIKQNKWFKSESEQANKDKALNQLITIMELANGNIGALSVINQLSQQKEWEKIMTNLLASKLRGANIWILFKDKNASSINLTVEAILKMKPIVEIETLDF